MYWIQNRGLANNSRAGRADHSHPADSQAANAPVKLVASGSGAEQALNAGREVPIAREQ